MGIKLKQAGDNDFMILEKANSLGGTWRDNSYPGAECDIPSALYSYSFERNSQWQFKWSGQAQILKYQNDTAQKYGLGTHIKFQQEVCSLHYDAAQHLWQVTTVGGALFLAQHVVCAIGQLHKPASPHLENREQFTGPVFHSANWNHAVDLENKNIVVIGNAASAVQFIPEIAKSAKHLSVIQRSPNWMLPKVDRPYSLVEQKLSNLFPLVSKLYRGFIWALGEYGILPAIKGNRVSSLLVRRACLKHLKSNIKDEKLRTLLTPKYPVGAKRVLFSDHYYASLTRENVDLLDCEVESFSPTGVIDKRANHIDADVVIYGTGFQTNPFLADINVLGINQQTIREVWADGAHAYLGVSTHGFPNLHLLYGPNTNLGHSSILIMLEAQADYVVQQMKYMQKNSYCASNVKVEIEQQFNHVLQQRLKKMAFNQIKQSWYKDGEKITNNWAGGTREYTKLLQTLNPNDFEYY